MTNPFLPPPDLPPHWLTMPIPLPSLPTHPLETASSRIELDATRRERIDSAIERLERVLKGRQRLAPLIRSVTPQGSIALQTAIRPPENGHFDVDVVLVMDVRRLPLAEIAPRPVLEHVIRGLSQHKWYADRLELRARCVRVRYEEGFHVDLVPAHADQPYEATGAPIYIPTADDRWELTHPAGFVRWFRNANRQSGGRLRQVVLLMKRWRDLHFESGPNSMLLTTMLGLMQEQRSLPLQRALEKRVAALDDAIAAHPSVPLVPNPSLDTENLARDWSREDHEIFRAELSALRTALTRASALRGRAQREVWREAFGDVVPL